MKLRHEFNVSVAQVTDGPMVELRGKGPLLKIKYNALKLHHVL